MAYNIYFWYKDRYMSKKLQRYIRTKSERVQDYLDVCHYMQSGCTWSEIHANILADRNYIVTQYMLKKDYAAMLEQQAIEKASENELDRAIEDLEAIMKKAIDAWNRSIGKVKRKTIKQKSVFDYEEITHTMKQNGDSKYLEVYLKAFEKRKELKGWSQPKEFNITHFLQNNKIDDTGAPAMKPIRSERQAKLNLG